jgi:hypothetical protein
MRLASLFRVGPAHHFGAVVDGLLAVEGSLRAVATAAAAAAAAAAAEPRRAQRVRAPACTRCPSPRPSLSAAVPSTPSSSTPPTAPAPSRPPSAAAFTAGRRQRLRLLASSTWGRRHCGGARIAGTEPSARAAVRRACAGAVPIALAAARGGAPGRPRVWLVVGAQAGRTCPPVKPWQMTFVSAKMAGKGRPSLVPNDRIGAAARQRCEARMVLRLASAMLVFLGVCDVPPSQVLGQKPHDFWQQIKRPSAWIKCAQGQYCRRCKRGSLGVHKYLAPGSLNSYRNRIARAGP